MEITGKVIINVRDATTMEIVETIEQSNVITKALYDRILNGESIIKNVYISPATSTSYEDWPWVPNCVTTGYIPAGISSPAIFPAAGSTPDYLQFMRRFDAPATTRTINTVSLPLTNTATVATVPLCLAGAYVSLSSPCIQTTTQILDVYYRLQFSSSNSKTYNYVPLTPAETSYCILYISGWNSIIDLYPSTNNNFGFGYGRVLSGSNEIPTTAGHMFNYVSCWIAPTKTFTSVYGENRYAWSEGTTSYVGVLQGNIQFSIGNWLNQTYACSTQNITAPNGSAIQPIFSHAASTLTLTTATPFMDITPATGSGTYNMGGTWTTGNLPELYKISIVTGGAVGTATYTLEKRNHVGFAGASYTTDTVALPGAFGITGDPNGHGLLTKPHTVAPYQTWNATGAYGHRMEKYDSTHFISYDTTGVSRYNITNHFVELWDSTTTPALPATNLRQACVKTSDGSIWAACANTGIYQISADGLTVTHFTTSNGLPSNVCRAIDIGRNNTVWAYTDGGMVSSADGGATWTVYNAGTPTVFNSTILTAEPSAVWYMRVDPKHANDRMCIVRHAEVTTNYAVGMIWWERSTGVVTNSNATTQTSSYGGYRRNPGLFNVSDNDSMWSLISSYANIPSSQLYIFTYGWATAVSANLLANSIVPTSSSYLSSIMFVRDSANTKDLVLALIVCNGTGGNSYMQFSPYSSNYDGSSSMAAFTLDNTGTIISQTVSQSNTYKTFHAMYVSEMNCTGLYMGNGVVVGYTYTRGPGDYNGAIKSRGTVGFITTLYGNSTPTGGALEYLIWDKYGWDGANWVLGNTNPKTTHVGEEPLIHGLTSRFTNGVAGTSFIAGEYYTNGVNDGILKNNAMTAAGTVITYLIPTSKLTSFDGVIRTYPWTTGLVVWRKAAASITINIDGSLTNNIPYRSYAMNACSKHRVFGDFSVSGTFSLQSSAVYSIGIKCDHTKEYPYVRENQHATWSFTVVGTAVTVRNSSDTNVYATYTITGTTTWNITRVGNTITFYIAGVSRYTTTDASYSFHVDARFRETSSTMIAFTINPVTINSSGVGYYTGMGDSTAGTGIYDNKQLRHVVVNTSDLSINGTPLTVCNATSATPPASGGVSYSQEEGMLFCHSSDVGKTVTGSYIVNFQAATPCNIPPV